MTKSSDPPPAGVVATFLDLYLADRKSGRVRSLPEYQDLFPGYGDVIASQWENLQTDAVVERPGGELPLETIGSYVIREEIGRGGQGLVYRAEDTRLGRPVALKVLIGTAAISESSRRRLFREAVAASRLDHPGVCAVYDAGVDSGLPYIAMRFVEGQTLARRIADARQRGAIDDVRESARLVERATRPLHVAHEAGLVHRDIKPGNIMVTPGGDPVILDFGLARDFDPGAAALTATGELMGTPAYMAPEQIAGNRSRVDRRVDVYALAVTLYECVTHRRPFDAPSRDRLYELVMRSPPPDPRTFNGAIPGDLAAILEVGLEKAPERRYQTAEALGDDLARFLNHEPILARPPGRMARLVRWARREPALAGLLVVLLVVVPLLGILGGYFLATRDDVAAVTRQRRTERFESLLAEGYALLEERGSRRATGVFEAARKLYPSDPQGYIGVVLAKLASRGSGDAEHALAVLDTAREAGVENAGFLPLRARALTLLGRVAEAKQAMAAWQSAPRDEIAYYVSGWLAIKDGHRGVEGAYRTALNALARAVSTSRHVRLIFHAQWAHAAGHARDRVAARTAADALAALWPESRWSWFWGGFALQEIGDLEGAKHACEKAIGLEPEFAGAHGALGVVLHLMGKEHESVAAHAENVRLDPKFWSARLRYGRQLERIGESDGAIEQYREAARLAPDRAGLHCILGNALYAAGRLDEAERAYEAALERDEKRSAAHIGLGNVSLKEGDRARAAEHYRRAIDVAPGDFKPRFNLGSLLATIDPAEARKHLEVAVQIRPDHPQTHFWLAVASCRQGAVEAGEEHFRTVVELEPDHTEAHLNLGQILMLRGETVEALGHLRRGHASSGTKRHPSLALIDRCERRILKAVRTDLRRGFRSETGPAERRAARRRAREGLTAIVDSWRQALENGSESRTRLKRKLDALESDRIIEGLQDAGRIDDLPENERSRWAALRAAIDDLATRFKS